MEERIGILGGSFNPVHIGHLIIAQDALERFALSKVVFMPAAQPPHKLGAALVEPAHRLEMLRIAREKDDRFDVSDLEIRRGGVSYTIDTARELARRYPEAKLHFIVGGDTLLELHTWRNIEELLAVCDFITLARPGDAMQSVTADRLRLPGPHAARLLKNVMYAHMVDVSSTDIRQRVARGQSIRYLVPPGVEHYILSRKLYSS